MKSADPSASARKPRLGRAELIAALGGEVVRFQDASSEVDDAAAAVLALERADLPVISMLWFAGPAPAARLRSVLRLTPHALSATLGRLELAGYARRVAADGSEVMELTEHARRWIDTLWGPIQRDGVRVLEQERTRDLAIVLRFMETIAPVQTQHAARIRALLQAPASGGRAHNRQRGGLSPAALRRVQLYVEANLSRRIRLEELAERAGLSPFHFARAFKTSMEVTPRSFMESRRIERAKKLLRESEQPLVQVALALGFSTQSHFTTTFRRATGFTPALYRRGKS